jgi:mono/diheme cytochrome c family protein
MRKGLFYITIALMLVAACKTKKETAKTEVAPIVKPALDCSTSGLTFAAVQSIFDKHCVSCHGYGGDGGYNFLVMNDIRRAAEKGELLGTIKWHRGFPKMPAQADQLDNVSINLIECWIANGMKE